MLWEFVYISVHYGRILLFSLSSIQTVMQLCHVKILSLPIGETRRVFLSVSIFECVVVHSSGS